MKIFIKIIGCVIVLLIITTGLFFLSKSRTFQFFGGMISGGDVQTNQSLLALTFDDGPTDNVPAILDILDKYDIKGTFFLIGDKIETHPEYTHMIISGGHQIGNHSYSHKRMVLKAPGFIKNEILGTDDLIRSLGYTGDIYFRSPYGKRLLILPYYLMKYNKPNIFWDLEPETYVTGSGQILEYILSRVGSGDIILLHPMYGGSSNQSLMILDSLISQLQDRGFEFVTVEQLLNLTDTRWKFWLR